MKPLRFLPLVALAATSLLLLKLAGLLLDGRDVLTGTKVLNAMGAQTEAHGEPGAKPAEATPAGEHQTAEAPPAAEAPAGGGHGAAEAPPPPVEGKAAEAKHGGEGEAKKEAKPAGPPTDVESVLQTEHRTKGEIALLESLAQRRQEIEKREKDLDLRLNLMKAAEQRVEEKINTLKELQGKIETSSNQQEVQKSERYKQLVGLYSSMKPKDAARIFDELDNSILLALMKEMKTQTMSAIFAAMNPAKTRALTVAIANEAKQKVAEKSPDELPPISGQ
jgi:flagellar motility protein MotE (MotC chaperone)